MFRELSAPVIRSTITAVGSRWYNMLRWIVNFVVTSTLRIFHNRAVGHIIVVELELNRDQPPDFGQILKRMLPQNSRSNVTYTSDCQLQLLYSDDGCGECSKPVE
jgi:hypothetical protein